MPEEQRRSQAEMTAAGAPGPRWRALLEARWQDRVREVTELSLAYHVAAAAAAAAAAGTAGAAGPAGPPEAEALLRRAVAARRRLADVEEALARLATGSFGHCESCGSAIPAGLLATVPETRYCPRCDAGAVRIRALTEYTPR